MTIRVSTIQYLLPVSPNFQFYIQNKVAFLLFLAREHGHIQIHPAQSSFPLSHSTHTTSHHIILPSQLLSSHSDVKSSRGTSDTKLFSWSSASWFLCNLFSGMLGCSWIFILEVSYVPIHPRKWERKGKKNVWGCRRGEKNPCKSQQQ